MINEILTDAGEMCGNHEDVFRMPGIWIYGIGGWEDCWEDRVVVTGGPCGCKDDIVTEKMH